MAEFFEVMKQARRMCKSIDNCDDCPLMDASTELCYLDKCPKEYNDKDFIWHEAAILKWGAENPEVRYPTWREWHSTNFPDSEDYITPCNFISKESVERSMRKKCADLACHQCINLPIPADIAKKLGIQPITNENSG